MRCKKCGKKIADGSFFCPKCGTIQENDLQDDFQNDMWEEDNILQSMRAQQKSRNKVIGIVAGSAAVVVITIVAVIIVFVVKPSTGAKKDLTVANNTVSGSNSTDSNSGNNGAWIRGGNPWGGTMDSKNEEADNIDVSNTTDPVFYEDSVIVDSMNGKVNENGEFVNWALYVTSKYKCSGPEIDYGMSHNLPNAEKNYMSNAKNGYDDYALAWEDACKGEKTECGYWQYVQSHTWFENQVGCNGATFILADDPSLAGTYSVSLSFNNNIEKTATFTLVYKGDYKTGTGWEVENIFWS